MLFRKDIQPRCAYCQYGTQVNEREVACRKQGIRRAEDSCRRFRYDPLRRQPPRPAVMPLEQLSEEDFRL